MPTVTSDPSYTRSARVPVIVGEVNISPVHFVHGTVREQRLGLIGLVRTTTHTSTMEPLAAFGFAANIAQFLSFATTLIQTSREIYHSGQGSSNKVLTLEATYKQLKDLSQNLGPGSEEDPAFVAEARSSPKNSISVNDDLSRVCKYDCIRLLNVIGHIKGRVGPKSRWQSFRIALKTVWKGREISELEERLGRTQNALTFQVCMSAVYEILFTFC